jgi:hypothetical protein
MTIVNDQLICDSINNIKSQCVTLSSDWLHTSANRSSTSSTSTTHIMSQMLGWLYERNEEIDDIPLLDDNEHKCSQSLKGKWAMRHEINCLVIWISDATVRTEFILTWT